MIVENIVKF